MRLSKSVGLCVGLMLFGGGCGPWGSDYFREGIGTDLNWPGLAEVTRLQDIYVGFICAQAGLDVVQIGDNLYCNRNLGPRNWALFVQAGMNDIDLRCDSYLAWLDNRRRSQAPILSQISDLSATTTSIMGTAGVGANPITIVGAAFGLASNTFTNLNSRLLLEIDKTTVQVVVLTNQRKYRNWIRHQTIDSRPTALYALRSYLRICMPFTIETKINATVTLFETGGPGALRDDGLTKPGAMGTGYLPPRRADRPIEVTALPPPEKMVINAASRTEETIRRDRGIEIQDALCVQGLLTGDFGKAGSPTRAAFAAFKAAFAGKPGFDGQSPGVIDNERQLIQFEKARRSEACDQRGLLSAYEVGLVTRFGAQSVRNRIKRAIDGVNSGLPDSEKLQIPPELLSPEGETVGDGIRSAVIGLRGHYQTLNLQPHIGGGGVIDEPLWKQITKDGLLQ